MSECEIREPDDGQLVAGARLLAESLGFTDRDAIPPWLMRSTAEGGGLVLAAIDADQAVVGLSYALPALGPDGPYLSSCGLAVAAEHRGEGIGRRLKLEQRRRACAFGYRSIRWTAEPLSARALGLYLTGLGARLTDYRAGLFDGVREGHGVPQDDVWIVWDDSASPPASASSRRVEIPRTLTGLRAPDKVAWRARARAGMQDALDRGLVGTAIERDPTAGRCWVRFDAALAS